MFFCFLKKNMFFKNPDRYSEDKYAHCYINHVLLFSWYRLGNKCVLANVKL